MNISTVIVDMTSIFSTQHFRHFGARNSVELELVCVSNVGGLTEKKAKPSLSSELGLKLRKV